MSDHLKALQGAIRDTRCEDYESGDCDGPDGCELCLALISRAACKALGDAAQHGGHRNAGGGLDALVAWLRGETPVNDYRMV